MSVLGEEGGQHGPTDRRWILDPIDGTTGFIEGTPCLGTQIALEVGVGALRRTPAIAAREP